MNRRFGESLRGIARAATSELSKLRQVADATLKSEPHRQIGGVMRSLKGRFTEDLCEDLIWFAWKDLRGSHEGLSISTKSVPVAVDESYVRRVAEYADAKLIRRLEAARYRCKVDKHVMVGDEFVMAVECKAFTEVSMLKRIMIDFDILKSVHPNLVCMLVQLESQMGGNYNELIPDELQFGDSAMVVISRFHNVDLKVSTLLQGERSVDRPIHDYPKKFTEKSLRQCVRSMQSILRKHC